MQVPFVAHCPLDRGQDTPSLGDIASLRDAASFRIAERLKASGLTADPIRIGGRISLHAPCDAPVDHIDSHNAVVGFVPGKNRHAGARIAEGRETGSSSGWGGFVSIGVESTRDSVKIVRDPSGAIPCYFCIAEGCLLVSSQLSLLRVAAGKAFPVRWDAIVMELAYPGLRTEETCLAGIFELLPGEYMEISSGSWSKGTAWRPGDHVGSSDTPSTFDDAAASVREAVRECATAWARRLDNMVLCLSGGLDSSILAATMIGYCHGLTAINLVSSTAEGDERSFSRAIARHLGLATREVELDFHSVDFSLSQAANLPRPAARCFTQAVDRATSAVVSEVEANAIVYGGGGDNVFCYLHSAHPACDHLLAGKSVGGFVRTVLELSEITGCSGWEIGFEAVRRAYHRQEWSWPRDTLYLGGDVRSSLPAAPRHPWLEGVETMLPGKRAHIAALIRAHAVIDYLNQKTTAWIIYPLLSQPIVEACLRVPSWYWCQGGMNRAVARAAFADRLPPLVTHRATKGGFGAFARRAFEAHIGVIREVLRYGYLAKHKIIDIRAVERALEDPSQLSDVLCNRLARLVDVEAWLSGQEVSG